MSCCAAAPKDALETLLTDTAADARAEARAQEMRLAASQPREGVSLLRLAAPGMRCGACVAALEGALTKLDGVLNARANLTAKTVAVEWRSAAMAPIEAVEAIERAGFTVFPLDDVSTDDADRHETVDLLRRMAVAGFAAANVMLLSVSIWAGAEGATRDLLHWISAAIALPTVAYSGRPFFASALAGLRAGRLNMDAPISLAVLLAAGASLYEVVHHGPHAYFDAAVSLLFLLLVGRWLGGVMRAGARSSARKLARMAPRGAWVATGDGARDFRAAEALRPGDVLLIAPGDRVAVDGVVTRGTSSLDRSLLTGESQAASVGPGDGVEAGALNLDGMLALRATATAAESTLSEIAELVAAAEERKSGLARLADQAARIYAPLVHGVALVVLLGWLLAGAAPRDAILTAVAVLIVTCPCALGLAAPMAQAVASGALFRRGVLLKDGAALERLAVVDRALFDKTGVLTLGRPTVVQAPVLSMEARTIAAALAEGSRHPSAQAVAVWTAAKDAAPVELADVREVAGCGVEAKTLDGRRVRLGSAAFCGSVLASADPDTAVSLVWLRIGEEAPAAFSLRDALRPGAVDAISSLQSAGVGVEILSGDRDLAVRAIAERVGAPWRSEVSPQGKIAAVATAQAVGAKAGGGVLMIGDGLNDAPALAAADVSIAPASASDVGRAAADLVFVGESLAAVSQAWAIARQTRAVILQNFALAAGYNLIAVPLAAAGMAGPLEAAIAMSTSSLLVTANALRIAHMAEGKSSGSDAKDSAPSPSPSPEQRVAA